MNPQLTQLIDRLEACIGIKLNTEAGTAYAVLSRDKAAEILAPLVESQEQLKLQSALADSLQRECTAAEAQIRECNEQIRTLRAALEVVRKAKDRACEVPHSVDIKWLIELPMTDAEHQTLTAALTTPPNAPKGTTT